MEPLRPRRAPRFSLHSKAWCEVGDTTLLLPIWNASHGGLFLRTPAPLPAGTQAKLRFRVDDDETEIVAQAEVVWSRRGGDSGMGVRFQSIDNGASALTRYLEEATPLS